MSYGRTNTSYGFDPSSVPEGDREDRFEPVPAGEYVLSIVGSEVKRTQRGGEGISFELEIQAPHHAGRKVFEWVNTAVPGSQEAERIGRGQLYRLTAAVGGGEPFAWTSTSQLHGRPFLGVVAIEDAKDGYPPKNRVKSYKPLPSMLQRAAQAAGAVPPPPARGNYSAPNAPPAGTHSERQYHYSQPAGPRTDVPPPTDDDTPF